VPIAHGWELASAPPGEQPTQWHPARVPGTAASALPDRDTDYDALDWWWRVRIDPAQTERVLRFDGVATLWEAWVDGALVASADSMWAARAAPLPARASELVIRCRSVTAELAKKRPRPRWKVPMLEQQQLRWIRTALLGRAPGWSPPWPAVGPWRPIWIEERAIGEVWIDARLDGDAGVVEVAAELVDGDAGIALVDGAAGGVGLAAELVDGAAGRVGVAADRATLVVERGGVRCTGELAPREGRLRGTCVVPDAVRWWPHTHGEPARYRVAIEAGDAAIDLGHIGFRTVELAGDMTVRINGVPVFCRGACWTPLDARSLHAAPAAYDAAIAQCVRAGMNMLRVGGTMVYEDDAFYDACDAHGVLLWHDLMFANMDYPDELDVLPEVREQAARWQARPALAIVCGNSEGAQQAAMFGATRDRWAPALFHDVIPRALADVLPRVPYVPS
jgi:beta-mannosidase